VNTPVFNNEIIPIKKKPPKKRNNEIITQYLTGSIVVTDESPVVGVSMNATSDIKCQK
jgi:hypothetical protein